MVVDCRRSYTTQSVVVAGYFGYSYYQSLYHPDPSSPTIDPTTAAPGPSGPPGGAPSASSSKLTSAATKTADSIVTGFVAAKRALNP